MLSVYVLCVYYVFLVVFRCCSIRFFIWLHNALLMHSLFLIVCVCVCVLAAYTPLFLVQFLIKRPHIEFSLSWCMVSGIVFNIVHTQSPNSLSLFSDIF